MAQGRVGWESTPEGQKQFKAAETDAYKSEYKFCLLCDAWLGCLGLEPTPEMFVANIVEIFREVKRVLRNNGTLWLNIGDSYFSTERGKAPGSAKQASNAEPAFDASVFIPKHPVLKPKDLLMIPHRVAIALQADGWYVRMDCVWHKPDVMPESVSDRPTKAHEYIFLLSKSQKYYYDAEAITEAVSPNTHARISQDLANQVGSFRANGGNKTNGPMKAVIKGSTRKIAESGSGIANNKSYEAARALMVTKRNKRSVWTVANQGYAAAHFATFPKDLIRPCILAGCPVGGTVLDPFAGSGTTLQVAREAQCKSIGIELNLKYCRLIEKRLSQGVLNFAAG